MPKLVTILGGSGFVGRYVAQRMARAGWRVRIATRRPNEAMFVKPFGAVGQVEPVLCNIRDANSVAEAINGADAVVNCVGILNETGANTFKAIHVDGAARVARLAAGASVARLVHISAIGADQTSDSNYASTKAQGEAVVLEHISDAVILRPSVVFGAEDRFFNRLAGMTRLGPVLPLVGCKTRFQPVYVDDLAKVVVLGIQSKAQGVYELGGPETATLAELTEKMLKVIHQNRIVVSVPNLAARGLAFGFDMAQKISFRLITNGVLTRDQLRNLAKDNVVSETANGFADLGISPVAMATVLPGYLWRFRPYGQYDDIMQSARNPRP